jgi:hypothetical protein
VPESGVVQLGGLGDPKLSCPLQVPPGGNKTQYEEISIPVALLSHRDLQDIFRVGGRAGLGGQGLGSGFWVQVLAVDSRLDREGSG